MEEFISRYGFAFKKIKSTNSMRPYRIECIELGNQENKKDSSISYEDAIELLIQPILSKQHLLTEKSMDKEYIKKAFTADLLGKKLSEINNIVSSEIADKKINGQICAIERAKFDMQQVYFTKYYKITVICENNMSREIIRIKVEKVDER